eukprot:3506530-Heterocapsa_arctica.AAC.1
MAHVERVEPQQPEALLGGQAPKRYAAAEEKLRGGLATERSRELKRFIEESGATPGCAGCKYCKWTPDRPGVGQSQ